jgi:hypothetical protein
MPDGSMSANQKPPRTPETLNQDLVARDALDITAAVRLVETAHAGAGITTTERERTACAKTLMRLAPGQSMHAGTEDFAATLRELRRG